MHDIKNNHFSLGQVLILLKTLLLAALIELILLVKGMLNLTLNKF